LPKNRRYKPAELRNGAAPYAAAQALLAAASPSILHGRQHAGACGAAFAALPGVPNRLRKTVTSAVNGVAAASAAKRIAKRMTTLRQYGGGAGGGMA
jgi:hypothetical protein